MDVTEYMASLKHSRKDEVERITGAILEAEPELSETIKWNAPNFVFDGEDRLTFRLQPNDRIELVFHRGSRKRSDADSFVFDDASGLINWATSDRGILAIPDAADLGPLLAAILPVIHAWVRA